MSQAVRDLPDPLDPSPSLSTSDPDDLLSKMADEAIDRLIADADNGKLPTARPPAPVTSIDEPPPAKAQEPPAVTAEIADEEEDNDDHEPAYPPAGAASGIVADKRVVEIDTPDTKPEEHAPPAESAEHTTSPIEHTEPEHGVADPTPDTHGTVGEQAHTHVAAEAPPPAADRAALLSDSASRASIVLLPLRMLNWPFAWIGDNARRVFGLLGIVTLVPAIAAIVYVLWLKKHWGG